jgi:FKBP-type peptidyl-prolyl cis-trans isomerase
MLTEAAAKFDGKVRFVYCDIDKFPQVAEMLEISTIPQTYMIYQGDLLDEFGGVPKDMAAVEAFFEKA